MTKLLERAIELLQQMPDERQDLLARLVLHEIGQDEQWIRSTETHADKLSGFVNEILDADRNGQCEPLDPDQL